MKQAVALVKRNEGALSTRPVWLFSVGPIGQWAKSTPVEAREVAGFKRAFGPIDHRVFAGAFDRGTMEGSDLSFLERQIGRRFIPEGDYRDWPAVDAWTDTIARRLVGG